MDRETLLQLSRGELVELVLGLAGRVAELEAMMARLGGPPKTPENSSVPPSHGFKPNRAERRRAKGGRRRGHAGISRRRQAPDLIGHRRPERCDGCGESLPVAGQRRVSCVSGEPTGSGQCCGLLGFRHGQPSMSRTAG